jgi:hypothetical protein
VTFFIGIFSEEFPLNWKLVPLIFAVSIFYLTSLLERPSSSGRFPTNEDETKYAWKLTFEDEFVNRDQAIAMGIPNHCLDGF